MLIEPGGQVPISSRTAPRLATCADERAGTNGFTVLEVQCDFVRRRQSRAIASVLLFALVFIQRYIQNGNEQDLVVYYRHPNAELAVPTADDYLPSSIPPASASPTTPAK
jgi:hypothetical protein